MSLRAPICEIDRLGCRILYLVGGLGLGGLQRQLYYLLQAMDRERYKPAVVVWNYQESDIYVRRIRELSVPLYAVPATPSKGAKLRALRLMVRQLQPEVVHSYIFYTNFAAFWASWATRSVVVGSVRNDFLRDRKSSGPLLGRLSALLPRYQIFNSFVSAEVARRSGGIFVPRQLFVVRNGMDLRVFQSSPVPNHGKICILGIGSLVSRKRWDRALEAVVPLKRSGLNFILRIAGDGPLRKPLEKKAQALDIADCVEFLGQREDIHRLCSDATMLLHTADQEGCPNVVMEAMASARPVIATDAGDVPHLVEDGKTGFVVRRGDDKALVKRIAALVANPKLCRRMGEAGRAKAEREFTLERLVTQTLAAYQAAGWKDSRI